MNRERDIPIAGLTGWTQIKEGIFNEAPGCRSLFTCATCQFPVCSVIILIHDYHPPRAIIC